MDQAQQLRDMIREDGRERTRARVITVTSGKGGVGKTSIALNLAIQFARLGKKAVVLDADFGLANIEVLLGIHPRYNLYDMIFEGKKLHEIVTVGPENVGFISGGSGIREMVNLSRDRLYAVSSRLKDLDHVADVILIDTGAGIDDAIMEFAAESDDVLLVVTSEPTSITDSYVLLKTLDRQIEGREGPKIHLLANQVAGDGEGAELFQKVNVVVNKFLKLNISHIGNIPQDKTVPKSIMAQTPFCLEYPNAPAGRAVRQLALALDGRAPEEEKRRGLAGIFRNLFHKN